LNRTAADGLKTLCEALTAEGGSLAELAREPGSAIGRDEPGPAQIAAAGPRARGRASEYELVLEMVREGILLHYGRGRVTPCSDPDLALLLGDQLYALGLSRLTAIGDLAAVAELADMIALIALAAAAGDEQLGSAVWEAGAIAVGWGADTGHEQAKALARAGRPEAPGELRRCAARALAR
jgi:hypothetical protein